MNILNMIYHTTSLTFKNTTIFILFITIIIYYISTICTTISFSLKEFPNELVLPVFGSHCDSFGSLGSSVGIIIVFELPFLDKVSFPLMRFLEELAILKHNQIFSHVLKERKMKKKIFNTNSIYYRSACILYNLINIFILRWCS